MMATALSKNYAVIIAYRSRLTILLMEQDKRGERTAI
jgi:hypothetical protein